MLDGPGDSSQFEWGYNIPLSASFVLQWFKLLLLNDEDLPAHLRKAEQLTIAREIIRLTGKTGRRCHIRLSQPVVEACDQQR